MSDLPEERPDPALVLRVSHADRDRVVEQLRDAAGDGRLDLDELEERLEKAFTAKTYADLGPLTADLPVDRRTPARRPPAGPVTPVATRSQAIMGEHKRTGVWTVGETYVATSIMGGVLIDLRTAVFTKAETVISCTAIMGDVKVRVGADDIVINDVHAIMGDASVKTSKGLPPMPSATSGDGRVVRLRGVAFMGSVTVERLAPDDNRLRRWRD